MAMQITVDASVAAQKRGEFLVDLTLGGVRFELTYSDVDMDAVLNAMVESGPDKYDHERIAGLMSFTCSVEGAQVGLSPQEEDDLRRVSDGLVMLFCLTPGIQESLELFDNPAFRRLAKDNGAIRVRHGFGEFEWELADGLLSALCGRFGCKFDD